MTILEELSAHGVRGVVVDDQVDEIRALPEKDVPEGLMDLLLGGTVDVLDASPQRISSSSASSSAVTARSFGHSRRCARPMSRSMGG